jgi:hypothetical protein
MATRLLIALAAVALLAVMTVASAEAAPSGRRVVARVHGIELIARHTQATFSGYATGGLSGGWLAVVDHTPLDPGARITGGKFSFVRSLNQLNHPFATSIERGAITMTNPGAHCTNQTFKVTGDLGHVDAYRTGAFALTLTHWRHSILGACISYFATTDGTLTLTS